MNGSKMLLKRKSGRKTFCRKKYRKFSSEQNYVAYKAVRHSDTTYEAGQNKPSTEARYTVSE